ncbi:hypothetical protein BDA99DRAFT_494146 [Phascolomyces articulosus]|uniref:Uncharacterized protein n=1 Tax=Phascolomyces articulosus TaxID=60185 RepID=A0AAD5KN47_9FUNG|nr:hypothetical protein BDA99DRAFT_494146 [Phascolomyces articulosus]
MISKKAKDINSPFTAIILDGHPTAFAATTRDHDSSIDRTQMLPPIPWWTCMVDSTLEFCRIGWETALNKLPEIAVIAAGEQPRYLVSSNQAGQVQKLVEGFKDVQPRQTTPEDRLQAAVHSLFQKSKENQSRNIRMILLILSKGNEDRYSYYNNEESEKRDIRAMIYDSFKDSTGFDSIHVDVLRLFPFTDGLLPNIEKTTFAPSATLSMYNIPNCSEALKMAMRNLAQLYYNVDLLQISKIPMNVRRQDGNAAMTQTVEFYARCTVTCYDDRHQQSNTNPQIKSNDTSLPIYDPRYLQSKIIQLTYVKRNKRVPNDMGWCSCQRLITPLVDDGPTQAYLGTILQGSVSYLVDPENMNTNKEWTHTLIADHGKVLLHVFDHRLENEFSKKVQTMVDKSNVKVENPSMRHSSSFPLITPDKVQEFVQMFIQPNLYPDVSQLTTNKKYDALKFSSESSLLAALSKNTYTSPNIELTSRWHTCFRDSMGTDKFPVILEDNRPIKDFANEVCNGSPLYSGFGLLSTLNLPVSASLNKIMNAAFSNNASQTRIAIAEIDIIVGQLSSVLAGKSSKMITNIKMLKEDSRLLAKRLLIALYLIGRRFMDSGTKTREMCNYLLKAINEKTTITGRTGERLDEDEEMEDVKPNEIGTNEGSFTVEAAWNQAKKFEGMTVREQEDSRYTLGTGIATLPPSVKNEDGVVPSTQALTQSRRGGRGRGRGRGGGRETPERNVSVNPNFMRHEGGEAGVNPRKRQSDMSGQQQKQKQKQQPAVPYLLNELSGNKGVDDDQTATHKTKEQEKNPFGPPGSFLSLYWNVDKQLREGKQGEKDGKVLVQRNNKWERIQKDFDGRMQQQQQQQQNNNNNKKK